MARPKIYQKIFDNNGLGSAFKHEAMPTQDKMPDQSGQSGKFLTTNGETTSWAEVQSGGVSSVTLASGTDNGTLKLTVDGVAQDNVAVTGLGTHAFKNGLTALDIPHLDAGKITSGTFDIDRIPATALNKVVVVATEAAKLELTIADVQVGDTVKVTATKKMYMVKDDSKLGTEGAFEEYVTSTDWSVVANKPTTIAGYGITDAQTAAVPAQSGQSGKYLTTDGTSTSWTSISGGVSSVALASGTNNGTLKLTVDGVAQDNVAVKGLGTAAYAASSDFAASSHSHAWANITSTPTTLAGYGIADAKIESGTITLGSNTITPVTSHQDISGKISVSGSRGSLAGYQTSGSATTISDSSADANETSATSITISAGSSGTSWTKIVRLTSSSTVSFTLGSGWVWVGNKAPTYKQNSILVCCWCGSGGLLNLALAS